MTDRPCCYDCLTEDVAVKVIDLCGFEHWFCAEDWAVEQEFHEKVMALLEDAARTFGQESP
jgi:prophage antirepressor-like protein